MTASSSCLLLTSKFLDFEHLEISINFLFSYISGSTTLGVTMSGTLLNHTNTKERVNVHAKNVETINPRVPHIWGETNSLFNQGRPNVSNAFGAALWGIDYNLCEYLLLCQTPYPLRRPPLLKHLRAVFNAIHVLRKAQCHTKQLFSSSYFILFEYFFPDPLSRLGI